MGLENATKISHGTDQVLMMRVLPNSKKYLLLLALISQATCDHDSTGPDDSAAPVTLGLGLDIRYPTLTAGPSGRIYTIRPNDLNTRRLDARDSDGSLVWTVVFPECTDECSRVPVVDAAGNVYAAGGQGLVSYNGTTGALRWTATGIRLGSLALGSNSRVYASNARFTANQPLYAFDASSGALVWTATISDGGVASVLLDESRKTLYALTRGKAVALDSESGAIKFTASPLLGSQCFGGSGSIASDGTIYVGCDNDMSSGLSAYAPTGGAKWFKHLAAASGTFTLIDGSGAIYVSNPASVTALTPDGEVIWKLDGIYQSNVHPVIDTQKNVYLIAARTSSADPEILVVNAGKIVGSKGPVAAGALGAFLLTTDGRVYYNSQGSLIYFQSHGNDASAQWAQMGRDEGRTSRR